MKRGIAWRRHQKFRKRNKAIRALHTWWWPSTTTEEDILEQARHMANNMKVCGRSCCCNPRHSGHNKGKQKLTVQERRYLINDFY